MERAIVEEELSHRAFIGDRFPAVARAAGYEPFKLDLTDPSSGGTFGPTKSYSE
ncbi:MAG: hypothetical protein M3065_21785 [Actinomycetota bacterium]|nr:hypothetical protein [Actinomycetota bacterium]